MLNHPSTYSAVLLCRGLGTILYANAPAIEQAGSFAGGAVAGHGTLLGLVSHLYPASRTMVATRLARVFRLARKRGSLRLKMVLPEQGAGPRDWDVLIAPCGGRMEETYQLSFRPSHRKEPMTDPQDHLLRTSAGHACRILDKALEASTDANGTSESLVCIIRRARGLLATLEKMPGGHSDLPRHPTVKHGD